MLKLNHRVSKLTVLILKIEFMGTYFTQLVQYSCLTKMIEFREIIVVIHISYISKNQYCSFKSK